MAHYRTRASVQSAQQIPPAGALLTIEVARGDGCPVGWMRLYGYFNVGMVMIVVNFVRTIFIGFMMYGIFMYEIVTNLMDV